MRIERPRARRYLFVATVELTDDQPFPTGARVRTRIAHSGASFVALGKVSYTTSDGGMGITFTHVEPKHQLILEKWMEEWRNH